MAITDVLRGLLGGAGGALAGYGIQQQREQERLERERIRQEAAAERREQREYERQRDKEQDALNAALRDLEMLDRGFRLAPEMAATGATFAPEAPELMRVREDLRPTAMDIPAPARPETRDGRIRGTDVGVAPGQTYSAVQKALMDAEMERPEPQPDTRMVMERGPRPIEARLPSAEERGAQAIRFPGDRTYVRERQLTPAEQREVDLKYGLDKIRAEEELRAQLIRDQRKSLAELANLSDAETKRFIALGSAGLEGFVGGLPAVAFNSLMKQIAEGVEDVDPETGIPFQRPLTEEEIDNLYNSAMRLYNMSSGGTRGVLGEGISRGGVNLSGLAGLGHGVSPLSPEQERRLQLGFSEEEALEPDTYVAPELNYVPQREIPSTELSPIDESVLDLVRRIREVPTYRAPGGGR